MLTVAYKYRYWLLLAAIWIVFECWISWAAFCDQPQYEAGNGEAHKKYDCVFRGPVFSIARGIIAWWKHTFDDAESYIALFTGVLAFSTITLWIATRDAANAAKRAAEHIPKVERAYLFVGPTKIRIGTRLLEESGPVQVTFCSLHIENQGKTPAILKRAYGEFSRSMPTADIPVYSHGSSRMLDSAIAAGNKIDLSIEFESEWTDPHYFFGFIEYEDIFRDIQTSRFCTKISPEGGWFNLAGPRSWNDWT